MSNPGSDFGRELLACAVDGTDPDEQPLRHVADLPPRQGRPQAWPQWADPDVVRAFIDRGIAAPWSHQTRGRQSRARRPPRRAQHRNRVGQVAGLPIADIDGAESESAGARAVPVADQGARPRPTARRGTRSPKPCRRLADVAPSSYDGDSPGEVRRFARERSRWIFSNPDMIHLSLLRNHARWAVFLRNLRYIVVDECHYYRGIFGSNVAMVLRRLLRLCTRYSSAARRR